MKLSKYQREREPQGIEIQGITKSPAKIPHTKIQPRAASLTMSNTFSIDL
jgi:hypothetical protein